MRGFVYHMGISADRIMNITLNTGALLLMVGVLVMALRSVSRRDLRGKLLIYLLLHAIAASACGISLSFTMGSDQPWLNILSALINTVLEITLNLQLCCVFFYVMYEAYKSEDYVRRRFGRSFWLLLLLVILPLISLFTGLFWYFDEEGAVQYTYAYLAYNVFRYLFLIAAVVFYIRCKAREKNARRFRMWLLVIPMALGTLAEFFTGYGAFMLGAAIGYTNLYLLIVYEMNNRDHETGFYNAYGLSRFYKLVESGKYQLSSILFYQLSEEEEARRFADVIRFVLPDECDTFRLRAGTFLTLSESSDPGYISLLREDVTELSREAGLSVSIESVTRKKDQEPAGFFNDHIRLREEADVNEGTHKRREGV